MIVFWRESQVGNWGQTMDRWRIYKGSVKIRLDRNGFQKLHIYPINGRRMKLSSYVAFDDVRSVPPIVISQGFGTMGDGVERLVKAGEVAEHLPKTYIDAYGNIRRTDAELSLVLIGPEWSDMQEEEFQEALALPF